MNNLKFRNAAISANKIRTNLLSMPLLKHDFFILAISRGVATKY